MSPRFPTKDDVIAEEAIMAGPVRVVVNSIVLKRRELPFRVEKSPRRI